MNRFIGLSACYHLREIEPYEVSVPHFLTYERLGIYNVFGNDESSLNEENCKEVSETDCANAGFNGQAVAIQSFMYYQQLGIEGRF